MSNGGGPKFDWSRYMPDARIWVMLGLFALAWRLLWMIAERPALLDSAPFMTIATLILGGSGIGAVVSFLFGGTKTGGEVMKSNAETLQASTPPASPIHVEVASASPVEPSA